MIIGEGATMFGSEMGMEIIDEHDLITEYEKQVIELKLNLNRT